MGFGKVSIRVAQFAVIALLASGAGACSSIPEWMGGDAKSSDDTVTPPDQTADQNATAPADQKTATDQTAQSTDKFPDLADVPDKPKQPSTPDERKQVQESLAADRSKAQYSSDNLKGGQDTAAAPPPPPGTEVADNTPDTTDKTADTDKSADTDKTANDNKPAETTSKSATEVPAAAPTAQVATNTTSTSTPAVPANAPGLPGMVSPSDAALGFKRSSAPALDGNVQNFVPQPIIERYRQTAAASSTMGVTNVAVATNTFVGTPSQAAVSLTPPPGTRKAKLATNTVDVGGPDKMTGAVTANFDSLASDNSAVPTQAAYVNPQGLPPAAVVFFPHDTTVLNAQAKAQVRAAAQAYLARGGQGFIRVVGHSSSRTANMPLQRHLVYNFERSQARANSVAQELIKAGVPAAKILVEAVGDTQPVYYESMPEGEEGNRRAEIFLQS
jgi:outer membrane protein OmpA-like peptidoglycan-associated protein